MSGEVFVRRYPIRFEHCDYAGILFFPHYTVLLNRTVEDWFDEALGCDFVELHDTRRLGIPTARLELDMQAPSRLGDVLDWHLTIDEVRNSAFVLRHEARCTLPDGATEQRLTAIQRIVFASLDGIRKTPIPDDLKPRIESFLPPR